MYEWYEEERLWNIDINRSFYEDTKIGELGIEIEYVIFENDLYRIVIEPLDSTEIVGFKIYKKDKEIYDICRISFFENKYIESTNPNSFKLNTQELFLFNQIINSPSIMEDPIKTINSEVNDLVFVHDKINLIRNNDFEKLSKLWNSISQDQIRNYNL